MKEVYNAAKIIVQALERVVDKEKGWNPEVYIGKTKDEERREEEHRRENPPLYYLTVVAEGDAEKINELEKAAIRLLEKSPILKMRNEIAGGGGSKNATELYVAFTKLIPGDDFEEWDIQERLCNKDLPISL